MPTDTSERGLERLICTALTGAPCDPGAAQTSAVREPGLPYGGSGWICGSQDDYDREYTIDLAQLRFFLRATQRKLVPVPLHDAISATRHSAHIKWIKNV